MNGLERLKKAPACVGGGEESEEKGKVLPRQNFYKSVVLKSLFNPLQFALEWAFGAVGNVSVYNWCVIDALIDTQ